jgi:hypothetical protein
MKDVGLGMETCLPGIERDPYTCVGKGEQEFYGHPDLFQWIYRPRI